MKKETTNKRNNLVVIQLNVVCISKRKSIDTFFTSNSLLKIGLLGTEKRPKRKNDHGSLSNRPQVFDFLPD